MAGDTFRRSTYRGTDKLRKLILLNRYGPHRNELLRYANDHKKISSIIVLRPFGGELVLLIKRFLKCSYRNPCLEQYALSNALPLHCDVCMLHYNLISEYRHYAAWEDSLPETLEFTPSKNRSVYVQAQALFYEDGTEGKDFLTAGRNTQLETQIIAAIEMAYNLKRNPGKRNPGL